MPGNPLVCPACKTPWSNDPEMLAALRTCPGCAQEVKVTLFTAFSREPPRGVQPEAILIDGEASCFYHPRKRASVPCGECGRFLCALCDVEMSGKHLCPVCLETARKDRTLAAFDTSRTLYDSAALTLSWAPLIFCWPVTALTAPAAIYCAVLSFSRPGSVVYRTRVRAYLAICFGLLQLAGWVLLLAGVLKGTHLE